MLIKKPILGILDKASFLILIDMLWEKADSFSLSKSGEYAKKLVDLPNVIDAEGNTLFFDLNLDTKKIILNQSSFLDFSDGSWCDLKFYSQKNTLFQVITHESCIMIDDRLYEFFVDCCKNLKEKSGSIKTLLQFYKVEKLKLEGATFSWKRSCDQRSITVCFDKKEEKFERNYCFIESFSSQIPENAKVKIKEVEFGSNDGFSVGARHLVVFSLSIVTDPPRMVRIGNYEIEETSLNLNAISVFAEDH